MDGSEITGKGRLESAMIDRRGKESDKADDFDFKECSRGMVAECFVPREDGVTDPVDRGPATLFEFAGEESSLRTLGVGDEPIGDLARRNLVVLFRRLRPGVLPRFFPSVGVGEPIKSAAVIGVRGESSWTPEDQNLDGVCVVFLTSPRQYPSTTPRVNITITHR